MPCAWCNDGKHVISTCREYKDHVASVGPTQAEADLNERRKQRSEESRRMRNAETRARRSELASLRTSLANSMVTSPAPGSPRNECNMPPVTLNDLHNLRSDLQNLRSHVDNIENQLRVQLGHLSRMFVLIEAEMKQINTAIGNADDDEETDALVNSMQGLGLGLRH